MLYGEYFQCFVFQSKQSEVWLLLINAADLRLQDNTVSAVGATCVEEHDDTVVSCFCFQEKIIYCKYFT